MIQVHVRFLSYLGTLVGAEQMELSLPDSARLADLLLRLQEMYPGQAALLARVTYLVDNKGASADTSLPDGAQVLALMGLGGG